LAFQEGSLDSNGEKLVPDRIWVLDFIWRYKGSLHEQASL
jgi:hypothetical protein